MKKAEVQPILMEVAKSLPEVARTNDAGGMKKSAAAGAKAGKVTDGARGKAGGGTKTGKKATAKRAKAKKPNEKITPASFVRASSGRLFATSIRIGLSSAFFMSSSRQLCQTRPQFHEKNGAFLRRSCVFLHYRARPWPRVPRALGALIVIHPRPCGAVCPDSKPGGTTRPLDRLAKLSIV